MKKFINKIYQKLLVGNPLGGRGVKNFSGSFSKTPFNPSVHTCKIRTFKERG